MHTFGSLRGETLLPEQRGAVQDMAPSVIYIDQVDQVFQADLPLVPIAIAAITCCDHRQRRRRKVQIPEQHPAGSRRTAFTCLHTVPDIDLMYLANSRIHKPLVG
jgi:hypothetical protein